MTMPRRIAVLALLVLTVSGLRVAAQDVATAARPVLTPQEMEAFLLNARIIDRKTVPKGVTNAFRVTLSDGRITHDAQVQNVDIFRTIFDVDPKHTEFNFRDSYRYNTAAYRLSRLLGLEIVPMSVPRTVDGKPSAMTWWLDDVAMDEGARLKLPGAQRLGPDPSRTSMYMHILRVFDELIQNRDRNSGNLLWTKDWTMWMIDHTRAFRTDEKLLSPELLERCERSLLTALRGLTTATVTKAVGDSLIKFEIDTLLARRDAIVKLFDAKIARSGEAAILYTLAR